MRERGSERATERVTERRKEEKKNEEIERQASGLERQWTGTVLRTENRQRVVEWGVIHVPGQTRL